MFPMVGGQGTRIIKREGIAEELGLRVKWAGVIVFALQLAVAAALLTCLLLGYVSLAILAVVVSFAMSFLLGYMANWERGITFLIGAFLAFFSGTLMLAVGEDIWNSVFGGIENGIQSLYKAIGQQWARGSGWGILLACAVWFAIAWTGRVKLASITVSIVSAFWLLAPVAMEISKFLVIFWKTARYFLLVFLWPIPVGAALLVIIAIQEMFMPNASVTISPLKLAEWKSLGPLGLGFFFERFRSGARGADAVETKNRYMIKKEEEKRITFSEIPFPQTGGSNGLAKYFAAVMADRATFSEAGSRIKKGQAQRYKGALAYGYSENQWRGGYIDKDGSQVPGLRDALINSGVAEKKGAKTVFTEEGAKHAAEYVRDHLGIEAVAEPFRKYLVK